jgi:prepilin-type N-terminal cleavage/methylation domain-containing protein
LKYPSRRKVADSPQTSYARGVKRYGFTVVELVITITIMAILLALAVANFNSSETSSRDAERASDTKTLATHLELFYKNGTNSSTSTGRYPSTAIFSNGQTSIKEFLPDIDLLSATAPGAPDASASFIPATNTNQLEGGVTPQPTISQYVYQPIQTNGSLCTAETQECRKFSLFYRSEVDNSIKKVISKNQ